MLNFLSFNFVFGLLKSDFKYVPPFGPNYIDLAESIKNDFKHVICALVIPRINNIFSTI